MGEFYTEAVEGINPGNIYDTDSGDSSRWLHSDPDWIMVCVMKRTNVYFMVCTSWIRWDGGG